MALDKNKVCSILTKTPPVTAGERLNSGGESLIAPAATEVLLHLHPTQTLPSDRPIRGQEVQVKDEGGGHRVDFGVQCKCICLPVKLTVVIVTQDIVIIP